MLCVVVLQLEDNAHTCSTVKVYQRSPAQAPSDLSLSQRVKVNLPHRYCHQLTANLYHQYFADPAFHTPVLLLYVRRSLSLLMRAIAVRS